MGDDEGEEKKEGEEEKKGAEGEDGGEKVVGEMVKQAINTKNVMMRVKFLEMFGALCLISKKGLEGRKGKEKKRENN